MGRKTALVISDALGDTACEVVLAAAAQFDEGLFRIVRVPKVADASVVARYLDPRLARGDDLSRSVAASYAGPRAVEDEMRDARALMGRLGGFVVRTDEEPLEESAAEIVVHLARGRARRCVRADRVRLRDARARCRDGGGRIDCERPWYFASPGERCPVPFGYIHILDV